MLSKIQKYRRYIRLYAFRFPVRRVNVVIIFEKIRSKTSLILRNAD